MNDVDSLKGLHGIKTLQHQKKRSIPKAQSSPYLDIYMMEKEKIRILKERKRLEMRYEQIKQRLDEIDAVMAKAMNENCIKNQETAVNAPLINDVKAQKDWAKMSLKY